MGCQSDVKIGDNLTFTVCTHDPDTGVLTDAAAVPAYRVYEGETGAAILTGNMAKLDDANTTGFYSEQLACTSGNGFEDGKSYSIYVSATVDGDLGGVTFNFAAHDHDCTDIQDDLDSDSVVVASVTGAAGSVTGAVGSVTGAVGSVAGNVDGSTASVSGAVGSVTGAVGSVTGAVGSVAGNVDGSTASVTGAVGSVTGAVGSVAGNVDGSVGSVSGAVGSVTGAVGSVTGAVGSVAGNVDGSAASVVGAVGSVAGNVDGNVTGSVGDLAAAAVNKIWDDLTAGMAQAGSIGKLVADYLDAQVSLCSLEATVGALNDLAQSDILDDATPFSGADIAELGAANLPADVDTLLTRVTAAVALEATLTAMKGATYSEATDSLEALRNQGDAARTTGGGGSGVNVTGIVSVPTLIDLADTAEVRLSVHVLDTSDDLPTTGEITPGTISIDRKVRGGPTWSAVVTDAACSESAGLVYYDEVFDDGTGYAVGDFIRVTFKGQAVVIGGNTHEVFPSGGSLWYSRVSALNDISSGGDSYYALPIAVTAEPESYTVEVAVVEP